MIALCRAVVLVLVFVVSRAFAGPVEVTTCGQVVEGRGVLVGDLDCSHGTEGAQVVLLTGRLDLNGYTITSPDQRHAVHCLGNCTVKGPGTLTGAGHGVLGRRTTKIKNVTITGMFGAVDQTTTLGKGRLLISRSMLTDNVYGVSSKAPMRLHETTIAGTARFGVEAGDWAASGYPCRSEAKLVLKRSSVTGNTGADPHCGTNMNCADVVTCDHPPRLVASTCGTSCQAATGIPCPTWGVCSSD